MALLMLNDRDLWRMQKGQPPLGEDILEFLTVGREMWLDRFRNHYLENFIASGGSKVKLVVGREGSGKSHLLRCIGIDAKKLGYEVVNLSAREVTNRLSDLPGLYRAIAREIDYFELVRGLCRAVAARLGFDAEQYDGYGRLLPLMVETEGLLEAQAKREIRIAAGETFKNIDIGLAFITFCWVVTREQLIEGNDQRIQIALRWFNGERLDRNERRLTGFFETLQKSNARSWLNSLVHLLRLAGRRGLLVTIDDLEVMLERNPESNRYIYTVNQVKDTCEIFRQIVDDAELLNRFALVLAGRSELMEDEKRGLISYEALWMRLQSGLVPSDRFNPLCDIVDTDALGRELGGDYLEQVGNRINQILHKNGYITKHRELNTMPTSSQIRQLIMEKTLRAERGDNFESC